MSRPLATLDFETDPFEFNIVPRPFCMGLQRKDKYLSIWADKDLIERCVEALESIEDPHIIYAHNGGRFDFFYLLKYFSGDLRIVNGRIVVARLGKHELRDSYAIMPFALKNYKKGEMDYNKLRRYCRHQHRAEILSYLESDCQYLMELVEAFHEEFGDNITIGSTAMKQLKKEHKFLTGDGTFDKTFRSQFYFGGRVQCFRSGIVNGPCKIYDVNSMYPFVMSGYLHPVGTGQNLSKNVSRETSFVVATGWNRGAFPTRTKLGGLDFTREYGTYYTTIHEWEAALETGMFRPDKVLKTYAFLQRNSFAAFVEKFSSKKIQAKLNSDKIHELFYKTILNSSYGKFAQNPDNYFDWQIREINEASPGAGWIPSNVHEGAYIIWKKAAESKRFFNVATGSSITGAARAVLMRGMAKSTGLLYCDTDSLICQSLDANLSETELGAWKIETEGDCCAIAGKKLYAVFNESERSRRAKLPKKELDEYIKKGLGETCVKKAHKGARLSGEEIRRIALGETIQTRNEVPRFSFDGTASFVQRKMRKTI